MFALPLPPGKSLPLAGLKNWPSKTAVSDLADFGEGFAFGDHIQRLAIAGGVEQRRQSMGFAAAKRRDEFQHAVAGAAGEAGEDVVQQRLQTRW